MISTPRLTQLPFETLLMGGVGFTLARLNNANEKLSASILAIGTVANTILFNMVDQWIRPHLKISSQAVYAGTNLVTSMVTLFAAQQFDLISRRMTGITAFALLGIFAARLKILANSRT